LSNRSLAIWQTKPSAELNINLSLEQLVLGSLKLEEGDKSKVIEHDPTAGDTR
jgi:hypothetical protein